MVRQIFSNATNETIAEIQSLYNMTGNADSTWDWTTDVVFGCNAINVAEAYKKRNLGNIYLHVVFKKRALGNIYSVSLENNWGGLCKMKPRRQFQKRLTLFPASFQSR